MIKFIESIVKFLLAYKNVVLVAFVIICMIVVGNTVNQCKSSEQGKDTIILKPTPTEIYSIVKKQDLYVCNAIMEEYELENKTEGVFLGLFPDKKHKRAVSVRKKCAYKIELGSVKFRIIDLEKTIYVKMPNVVYESEEYVDRVRTLCDDPDFWENYDYNEAAKKALKNIDQKFDTEENRKKASLRAMTTIQYLVLAICSKNYKVEFVNDIEHIKENYEKTLQ